MATPEIKILLDEEAIREQIRSAVGEEFENLSYRLRYAADALDGGKWLREHEKIIKSEYERGYQAGLGAQA